MTDSVEHLPLRWQDLGLSPVAFHLGPLDIRWYALSYLAMIGLGWWYMRRLIGAWSIFGGA